MRQNYIEKQESESYYVQHPDCEYAIFMISEKGDLMIHSDYGISCFAWRSFGGYTLPEFKKFLSGLNEGYWRSKMEYNLNYMGAKKSNVKSFCDHVWPSFQYFQSELIKQL